LSATAQPRIAGAGNFTVFESLRAESFDDFSISPDENWIVTLSGNRDYVLNILHIPSKKKWSYNLNLKFTESPYGKWFSNCFAKDNSRIYFGDLSAPLDPQMVKIDFTKDKYPLKMDKFEGSFLGFNGIVRDREGRHIGSFWDTHYDKWDRGKFTWTNDGADLYESALENGRSCLYLSSGVGSKKIKKDINFSIVVDAHLNGFKSIPLFKNIPNTVTKALGGKIPKEDLARLINFFTPKESALIVSFESLSISPDKKTLAAVVTIDTGSMNFFETSYGVLIPLEEKELVAYPFSKNTGKIIWSNDSRRIYYYAEKVKGGNSTVYRLEIKDMKKIAKAFPKPRKIAEYKDPYALERALELERKKQTLEEHYRLLSEEFKKDKLVVNIKDGYVLLEGNQILKLDSLYGVPTHDWDYFDEYLKEHFIGKRAKIILPDLEKFEKEYSMEMSPFPGMKQEDMPKDPKYHTLYGKIKADIIIDGKSMVKEIQEELQRCYPVWNYLDFVKSTGLPGPKMNSITILEKGTGHSGFVQARAGSKICLYAIPGFHIAGRPVSGGASYFYPEWSTTHGTVDPTFGGQTSHIVPSDLHNGTTYWITAKERNHEGELVEGKFRVDVIGQNTAVPVKVGDQATLSATAAVPQKFAASSVKITSPSNGTIVHPGQTVTVTIEASGGFAIKDGTLFVSRNNSGTFTSLPATLTVTVPQESVGICGLVASAMDLDGNLVTDQVSLKVQQIATVQALRAQSGAFNLYLGWNNNITFGWGGDASPGSVLYSDGVARIHPRDDFTYVSSDPSVVTVDYQGFYNVRKVDNAAIMVSLGEISQNFPLVFHQPHGIRPNQTTPFTIAMDIEPKPNTAGWNNSDITITLTAQATAQSKGIENVGYEFPHLSGRSTLVYHDQAIISFSTEGVNPFRYDATDMEHNDIVQETVIRLDKTPPKVTLSATPSTLWPPNGKMVGVTINGSATDKLSGIDTVTFNVVDSYGTCQPTLTGFGSTIQLEAARNGNDKNDRTYTITAIAKDKAGNQTVASTTVTVSHDQGK